MALSVLAILLAGCARFGFGGGGTPITSPSQTAIGGAWVLQSGSGPDGPIEVPDDYRVTLTFDSDGVHGQACNHYGGSYQLDGTAISFSAMSMTEMACQEPMMTVEARYHAALAAVTQVARTGEQLTLIGEGTRLTFTELAPVPDAALQGTYWILETLIDGDVASSVQGNGWLRLNGDGTLAGSTGCRELVGRYVVDGDQVVATDLAADGECSAALRAQDAHVVEVLGDGFSVAIDGASLTLSQPDGNALGYRAPGED